MEKAVVQTEKHSKDLNQTVDEKFPMLTRQHLNFTLQQHNN